MANEEEKQNISRLEKQLGLKRRKSKNLPKSFAEDGLDYLINVSDTTKIEALGDELSEEENDEEFIKKMRLGGYDSEDSNQGDESDSEKDNDEEMDNFIEQSLQSDPEEDDVEVKPGNAIDMEEESDDDQAEESGNEGSHDEEIDSGGERGQTDDLEEEDQTWEDIYGRTRTKDGAIVPDQPTPQGEVIGSSGGGGKYLPPAVRKAMEAKQGQSEEKKILLQRLAKQLKGQLNRLAETNMAGIAKFVEGSYRQHARNDVNQTITDLTISALVLPTLTPNRLVMEHAMLLAILHANVGTEVGAHFLQNVVKLFSNTYAKAVTSKEDGESKDQAKAEAEAKVTMLDSEKTKWKNMYAHSRR